MQNVLGIFVKQPVPGRVKTRLAAAIGVQSAADLYAAFQLDVIDRFRHCADQRILAYSPHESVAAEHFRSVAASDFELWPQPETPLGERIASFFDEAFEQAAGRVVLIGSDSPSLPASFVDDAFRRLANVDCVIGPATDGGYYLVGLRMKAAAVFAEIDWSSRHVFGQTLERVVSLGLSLSVLPPWYDVDTVDDLSVLSGHVRALDYSDQEPPLHRTSVMLRELLDAPNY